MITVLPRNQDGTLSSFAWPGGYRLWYYGWENDEWVTLCPECANDYSRDTERMETFEFDCAYPVWEGDPTLCDECQAEYPSEYGNPYAPED